MISFDRFNFEILKEIDEREHDFYGFESAPVQSQMVLPTVHAFQTGHYVLEGERVAVPVERIRFGFLREKQEF
jgi:hypothetical protein